MNTETKCDDACIYSAMDRGCSIERLIYMHRVLVCGGG